MSKTDDDARKEYADAGVNLPEVTEPKEPEAATPKEPEVPAKPEEKPEGEPEDEAPSQEPKEPRKRSIYDDYKDKKEELKTEKDLREQAERERDDLKSKLEAVSKAETPAEKKDAQDEIDAFITSHKEWDKAAISDLIAIARKGVAPQLPDNVLADLKDFQQWKTTNAKAMEEQAFAREYEASLPALKEILPTATDEEMKAVRTELDRLGHTKEFHDKPLDYVAFKNRTALTALISPKKRGLERKGRAESDAVEFDFDPSADYSKLSPDERTKWEEAYKKATASSGLLEDAQGRKLIL